MPRRHRATSCTRTPDCAGSPGRARQPGGVNGGTLTRPPAWRSGRAKRFYLSWASSKPKPAGTLFASDLYLSRSVNGGQSFEPPLRINDYRPISHSFEGLAVAADGTVLVAWIDSREGANKAGTYLARLTHQGTQIASRVTLDSTTCVRCRVAVATGPPQVVAVTWRAVLPGNIRDMVLRLAHDGGQVLTPATRIHADDWQLTACPHCGGSVGVDGQGRLFLGWYTEGTTEEPRLLFTVSSDGQQFAPPTRLDTSTTSIPDHLRMAVDAAGRILVVWEDALWQFGAACCSARAWMVGRRSVPARRLSQAIKAYSPDVAVAPDGGFVVVWHEEHFPALKTIVQPVRLQQ